MFIIHNYDVINISYNMSQLEYHWWPPLSTGPLYPPVLELFRKLGRLGIFLQLISWQDESNIGTYCSDNSLTSGYLGCARHRNHTPDLWTVWSIIYMWNQYNTFMEHRSSKPVFNPPMRCLCHRHCKPDTPTLIPRSVLTPLVGLYGWSKRELLVFDPGLICARRSASGKLRWTSCVYWVWTLNPLTAGAAYIRIFIFH